MVRRPANWLLLPVALIFATALSVPQLLFLGYDLRGLLERGGVQPASPPPEGLAYAVDAGPEWLVAGNLLYPANFTASQQYGADLKLRYEIEDMVLAAAL